jgi:hypothetical protein
VLEVSPCHQRKKREARHGGPAKAEKDEKKQAAAAASNVAEGREVAAHKQEEESLIERIERMQLEDLNLTRQHHDVKGTCLHSLASLPDGYALCKEFVDEFGEKSLLSLLVVLCH